MANESKGKGGGLREALSNSPAAQRVMSEARNYAQTRARNLATSAVGKVGDFSGQLNDYAENGGSPAMKGAGKLAEGKSPLTAAASAAKEKVTEKVKGMFHKGSGGGGKKTVNITETIDVGVPRSTAYNQWTQFQEFTSFSKGVQTVDQADDNQVNWRAKIAFSSRSWESTIQEQIPDYKIVWNSKGAKGSVDGVVTFHEVTPDLTRVVMHLVYHPQGLFEKTGNLWRAQGRRARLDLKGFSRFLMLQGEESGAWRGEIHDGQVTKTPEEAEQEDQQGDEDEQKSQNRGQDKQQSDSGDEDKQASNGRGQSKQRSQGQDQDKQKSQSRGQDKQQSDSGDDEKQASNGRGQSKQRSQGQDQDKQASNGRGQSKQGQGSGQTRRPRKATTRQRATAGSRS